MAHAKPPGPKERRLNDGNNNGQLRIAMPPRVAHAKPPGPIELCNMWLNNFQDEERFLILPNSFNCSK